VVTVGADGTVLTGTGEPGTTATVRDASGLILGTAVVATDGSFSVALTPAQANGGAVSVTLADAAGNVPDDHRPRAGYHRACTPSRPDHGGRCDRDRHG